MAQRGTSSASAQRIPWVTETVDKYRLSENDLLRFLRKIFGEYDSRVFGIQVRTVSHLLHARQKIDLELTLVAERG